MKERSLDELIQMQRRMEEDGFVLWNDATRKLHQHAELMIGLGKIRQQIAFMKEDS